MNIIDIGSGPHPKPDASVRMDIHDWPGVNLKHNLMSVPYPLEDNFFSKAYMGDVVEHISIFHIDNVLKEVHRILRPNGELEVTVPDVLWIAQRLVAGDWKEKANVGWLNSSEHGWESAMSYLFGGFHNRFEYQLEGMGHVNGFCEESLARLLEKNGFGFCQRIPDNRNPYPANQSILRMTCRK